VNRPGTVTLLACADCGLRPPGRVYGGARKTRAEFANLCGSCRKKAYWRAKSTTVVARERAARPTPAPLPKGIGLHKLRALVDEFGGYYIAKRAAEWWATGRMPR
jgi:hypothetical protein